MPSNFIITEDHIKLLENSNIRYQEGEFGGAGIDCKRPYGSTYVYDDIARILEEDYDEEKDYDEKYEYYSKIHKELVVVMEICFNIKELKTGYYEFDGYYSKWIRVADVPKDDEIIVNFIKDTCIAIVYYMNDKIFSCHYNNNKNSLDISCAEDMEKFMQVCALIGKKGKIPNLIIKRNDEE